MGRVIFSFEVKKNVPANPGHGFSEKQKGFEMTSITSCAHRGASSQAPENTLAALELALEQGAAMAEIDIQQTSDNELVLFHDDNLDRTSNGTGPLWKHTLEQLKLLDVGMWFSSKFKGEKILTLEEAVNAMEGRLGLNIELKLHGNERDLEKLVAEKLHQLGCLDWCLVTSFDHETVDRLGRNLPALKAGYIVGKNNWDEKLLKSWVSVLSLEKSLITADLVARVHGVGKEVHAWTVNDRQEMIRLKGWGVDVIISNYPDLAAEVAGSQE